ncbi:hypothetical protein N431DRAFT_564814 [Stipitochalara longipes BDJ]|nr:hypothetical protein N431DRAFT_564814 [Stipitochalara longipes BDJ]
MQFSKVVAALASVSLTLGATVPLQERVFSDAGITFRGEIGGHAFEETGTAQAVWATLKARHPEIELTKRSATPAVEKRDKGIPPLCIPISAWPSWNFAEAVAIEDGVDYLIGLDATLTNGPGPGNCGRISCSYNSAIYWCNDNDEDYSVNSAYIATFAQDMLKYCQHCTGTPTGQFCVVGGQEFEYDDNYNVIVRDASC